jgi:hypothetical protein
MLSTRLWALTTLCAIAISLPALDPHLRLDRDQWEVDLGADSQHVDSGRIVSSRPAASLSTVGSLERVGIRGDFWLALSEDEERGVEAGDFIEARLSADLLLEDPDYWQIIPHYRGTFYPYDNDIDNPQWVGVDGWYLLPLQGAEIGASLQIDSTGDNGWRVSAGGRQFWQFAPFDFRTWQILRGGDDEYNQWVAGNDDNGISTLDLGWETTIPMPYEYWWAFLTAEAFVWLGDEDRVDEENDVEVVLRVGIRYQQ